tara:strand:- start:432 stop:683 length:252 start_codon:yes stop_codon:yes gene_type:complete
MEKQMKINKRTESLPNMEEPQLSVSMLQHMEQMGLLPVSHEDDGIDNIEIPNGVYGKRGGNSKRGNINSFRRDVLDKKGEPLF